MSELNQVTVIEEDESLIMVGEGEIEGHPPLIEDDDFLANSTPHCGLGEICDVCQ